MYEVCDPSCLQTFSKEHKIEKQKEKERATCRQRHTYIYVSDVDIQMYRQKYIYRLIFITLSSVICFMIFQLQDTFYNNTCRLSLRAIFCLQQRHINIIEDQRHK